MNKSFKQFVTEAKKMEYDIADFDEDGLDDLQYALEDNGAKADKDYEFNNGKLCCYSKKCSDVAEKQFHL